MNKNIKLYSADKRLVRLSEYIDDTGESYGDMHFVLLPIPSSRDGVHITGTDEVLADAVSAAPQDSIIVGYDIPYNAVFTAKQRGIRLLDAAEDEDFLRENAHLTAEGALGRLLTDSSTALSDMRIGVVGLGRIGSYLCDMLAAVGASVVAFSGRGAQARTDALILPYSELGKIKKYALDILVNTAPAKLLGGVAEDDLYGIKLIELASGVNYPEGIKYERYGALPAVMYIDSAADAFIRFFKKAMITETSR